MGRKRASCIGKITNGATHKSGSCILAATDYGNYVITAAHIFNRERPTSLGECKIERMLNEARLDTLVCAYHPEFFVMDVRENIDIAVFRITTEASIERFKVESAKEKMCRGLVGFPEKNQGTECPGWVLDVEFTTVTDSKLFSTINTSLEDEQDDPKGLVIGFSGGAYISEKEEDLFISGMHTRVLHEDGAYHAIVGASMEYIEQLMCENWETLGFGLKPEKIFERSESESKAEKENTGDAEEWENVYRKSVDQFWESNSSARLLKNGAWEGHPISDIFVFPKLDQTIDLSDNCNYLLWAPNGYGKSTLLSCMAMAANYEWHGQSDKKKAKFFQSVRKKYKISEADFYFYIKATDFEDAYNRFAKGIVKTDGSETIPIDDSLMKTVLMSMCIKDIETERLEACFKNKRVWFLIDGLDEMTDLNLVKAFIRVPLSMDSDKRFFFTARDLEISDTGNYEKRKICCWDIDCDEDKKRIKAIVRKYRSIDEITEDAFLQRVENSLFLRELTKTSFMIAYLAFLMKKTDSEDEIIGTLICEMASRYSGYERKKRLATLMTWGEIAYDNLLRNSLGMKKNTLIEKGIKEEDVDFYIVKVGLLQKRNRNSDEYEFIVPELFSKYLCAKYLRKSFVNEETMKLARIEEYINKIFALKDSYRYDVILFLFTQNFFGDEISESDLSTDSRDNDLVLAQAVLLRLSYMYYFGDVEETEKARIIQLITDICNCSFSDNQIASKNRKEKSKTLIFVNHFLESVKDHGEP